LGALSTPISPGDILLFYRPPGRFSLTTIFTRSPYYHVAIAVDERYIIEAMPVGVIRTALETKRGERFAIIDPPTKAAAEQAVAWAIRNIGDGYDPKDLVSLAFGRVFAHLHVNFTSRNRYTCGEFVATAFKKAGKPLFADLEPEEVVPADFARMLEHPH
jgi:uncharacterized protein YycO